MKRRQGFLEWKKLSTLDPSANRWLLLDRTEAELSRRVDTARIWVRLGPALGLAGTLIPLGSALTALAANDLQILSQRLISSVWNHCVGIGPQGVSRGLSLRRWNVGTASIWRKFVTVWSPKNEIETYAFRSWFVER